LPPFIWNPFFLYSHQDIKSLFLLNSLYKILLFSLTYNQSSCCMVLCDTYLKTSYIMKSMKKTSVLFQNFSKPTVGLAVHQKKKKNDSCVYVSRTVSGRKSVILHLNCLKGCCVSKSYTWGPTHLTKDCYQNSSYGKRPSLLCTLFQISHNKPINHFCGNCLVGSKGA